MKRMRLPNGFGQITKLKKNLRNPYRAMITVGYNEKGKPVQKLLAPRAYFGTYNDAYAALVEYNQRKEVAYMTVGELYREWYTAHSPKLSRSGLRRIDLAYRYLSDITDAPITEIRVREIKQILMDADTTDNIKKSIKGILDNVFDLAMRYDYVDKNYSRLIKLNELDLDLTAKQGHRAFTEEEMNVLWSHIDDIEVQNIIIACYSGWRPQELTNIRMKDITNGFMQGGMKTTAGKDRIVPVHSRIQNIIEGRRGQEWLLMEEGNKKQNYKYFSNVFHRVMKRYHLNNEHQPHDCRVQFVTMCKLADVDEYAIKRIVGHAIPDITEKVYTKRGPEWLKKEIEKIK